MAVSAIASLLPALGSPSSVGTAAPNVLNAAAGAVQFGTAATTTAINSTTGSTFVIFAVANISSGITTINDNKGNLYQKKTYRAQNSSTAWIAMYVCEGGNGGTGHTASIGSSANGAMSLYLVELSGNLMCLLSDFVDDSFNATTTYPNLSTTDKDLVLSFAGNITGADATVSSKTGSIIASVLNGATAGTTGVVAARRQPGSEIVNNVFSWTSGSTPFVGGIIAAFRTKPSTLSWKTYSVTSAFAASIQATSVKYYAGQPIIVESLSGVDLSIADTSTLTWNIGAGGVRGDGNYGYVWYAIPPTDGVTTITVSRSGSDWIHMVARAFEVNAGTPAGFTTGAVGSYTSAATPFSATVNPTSTGSAIWMSSQTGGGNAPTAGSGCVIDHTGVAAGQWTLASIRPTASPLTSSSPFTLSGTTTTDFQWMAWIVYEVPSTYSAASSAILAAAAIAQASASAQLALAKQLQAAATGASSGSADLSVVPAGTAQTLAAAAQALSSATADLSKAVAMAMSANGSGSATADLLKGVTLAGAAIGLSTATGSLSHAVPLGASAVAAVLSTAGLSLSVALAANAIGQSTGSGSLSLAVRLAASAVAQTSAQATLSTSSANQVNLAANAVAGSSASAVILLQVPLSAAALANAQASGVLDVRVNLGAQALASSLAGASLRQDVTLAAAGVSLSQVAADLSVMSTAQSWATARRVIERARRWEANDSQRSWIASESARRFAVEEGTARSFEVREIKRMHAALDEDYS